MANRDVTEFFTEELRQVGERAIRGVVQQLQRGFARAAFRSIYLRHLTDDTLKPSIYADQRAEDEFCERLARFRRNTFSSIRVVGEESIRHGSFVADHGTFVLIDTLDGSDLYERAMGNWCAAATFFTPENPPGRQIRAAIVGLPDGTVYVAGDEECPAVEVVISEDGKTRDLRGKSNVQKLIDASICFYGQKIRNLLLTAQKPGWQSILNDVQKIESETKKKRVVPRVYNLAGIPMMMKLIDRPTEGTLGVDIVMDLLGQQAHDVVPGAFIAKRAGAMVVDLEGNEISFQRLEEAIRIETENPGKGRLKYIIASTPALADEAVAVFGDRG